MTLKEELLRLIDWLNNPQEDWVSARNVDLDMWRDFLENLVKQKLLKASWQEIDSLSPEMKKKVATLFNP
jgi:hypothetical protein